MLQLLTHHYQDRVRLHPPCPRQIPLHSAHLAHATRYCFAGILARRVSNLWLCFDTHTKKVTPNKEMPDSIIISPGGIKLPQALMENLQSEVFAPHSIQRSFSLCPPHIPRKSQEPQKPHCNTRGTARTHRIHSLAGGIKNGTNSQAPTFASLGVCGILHRGTRLTHFLSLSQAFLMPASEVGTSARWWGRNWRLLTCTGKCKRFCGSLSKASTDR